ncbi:MAG TPA: hypothetical protein VFO77_10015, partial [Actinoplanes sp.]|nr:hypothetical protein [Actinoplanes sp.]
MTDTSHDLRSPVGQARSRLGWKILTIVSALALLTVGIFLAARPSEPTARAAQPTQPAASTEPGTAVDPQTLAFQTQLDQSLQRMLDSVLGPGNSVVTTTATLDFVQADPVVSASAASDGVLGPDSVRVPDSSHSAAAGEYENSETV